MENEKRNLSHIDQSGNARMVDVGTKTVQHRIAESAGLIRMSADTLKAVREDGVKKGNVLAVARVAGILAAKSTPSLIPLCHTLPLDSVGIDYEFLDEGITATCRVSCQARTGVEMETLTGVSVALLTIYDMCKALDKKMVISDIRLIRKEKKDPDS